MGNPTIILSLVGLVSSLSADTLVFSHLVTFSFLVVRSQLHLVFVQMISQEEKEPLPDSSYSLPQFCQKQTIGNQFRKCPFKGKYLR